MKGKETAVGNRLGRPSPATWFSFAGASLLAAAVAFGVSFVWFIGAFGALLFADLAVVGLTCLGAGAVSLASPRAALIAAPFIWLCIAANTELLPAASQLLRRDAHGNSQTQSSSIALKRAPVLTLGGNLRPFLVAGGQPGQSCPEANVAGGLSAVSDMDQYSYALDPLQIARMVAAPTEIGHESPDFTVSVVDAPDARQVIVRLATSVGSRDFKFWREHRSSSDSRYGPPPAITPGKVLQWIFSCNAIRYFFSLNTSRVLPSPIDALAATIARWTNREYLYYDSPQALPNATMMALGAPEFERMPIDRTRGWPLGCGQLTKRQAWGQGPVVRDGRNGNLLSLDERLRVIACIDSANPVYVLGDVERNPWEFRVLDRTATPVQLFRVAPPVSVKPTSLLEIAVRSWMPEQMSLEISVITTTDDRRSADNSIAVSRQAFVLRLTSR